jgi:toxin ParE1/3/4
MLVRWTQPAADDLLHICDYTAGRFDAAVAHRVADAIFETAASLQDMPNRGRKGRKPNTREMLISGFPFVIIYRVGRDAVEIARILHTSQQWPQSP